jgi:hypothetical protein
MAISKNEAQLVKLASMGKQQSSAAVFY